MRDALAVIGVAVVLFVLYCLYVGYQSAKAIYHDEGGGWSLRPTDAKKTGRR